MSEQTGTRSGRRAGAGAVLGIVALVVGVLVIRPTAPVPPPRPTASTGMSTVAHYELADGAPGYLARIDHGDRVELTAEGVADRETGRRLTVDDQFEIGSVTKTFMASLTLQLVDEGRVELDRPIEDYLPGVVPDGRDITVRMLLNHTSGIYNYTDDEVFRRSVFTDPERVWSEKEILELAFRYDPNFPPGTNWSYSNTGYIVIGRLLTSVTGETLSRLVRERITEPLGLKHTHLPDPGTVEAGDTYAQGYAFDGVSSYAEAAWSVVNGGGGADGGIISTAGDLAVFLPAVLQARLFSAQQLGEMRTTVEQRRGYLVTGGYGLGLMWFKSPCGKVWGHDGQTTGHRTTALATEDGGRTAVSALTAVPGPDAGDEDVERWYQLAQAAQDTAVCTMLDQPVPREVTDSLTGRTPSPPL
ncbi:serine hydrolase domain-containing protein [Kineosporia succinea]|uniref:D-alanyl-D-alanine carboxypeptidase n=1 Tax=Kineosporia succinea TaxID=84632 RepID=A0ABT9P9P4_9ACTN|nr:serine hydrolase domain-containing protein [Kineosporia succinea]MDP9828755.1 D-alanyl-D-alanine carboxypeptidase [Kineosporia succinea]